MYLTLASRIDLHNYISNAHVEAVDRLQGEIFNERTYAQFCRKSGKDYLFFPIHGHILCIFFIKRHQS